MTANNPLTRPSDVVSVATAVAIALLLVVSPIAGVTPSIADNAEAASSNLSGDRVYSIEDDGTIHAYYVDNGTEAWSKGSTFSDSGRDIAVDHNESTVYAVAADPEGDLVALNATDGSEKWRVSYSNNNLNKVEVHAEAGIVAVTDRTDNKVHLAATNGSKLWSSTAYGNQVNGVSISDDGETVYAADDQVKSWYADNGTKITEYPQVESYIFGLDAVEEENRLYYGTGNGYYGSINISNESKEWSRSSGSTGTWWGVIYSEETGTLWGANDSALYEFDATNGDKLQSSQSFADYGSGITLSKDQQAVISGNYGGDVDVVDSGDGSLIWDSTETTIQGVAASGERSLQAAVNDTLTLKTDRRLLNHSKSTQYQVFYTNESGRYNVTTQANVTSANSSIASISGEKIVATSNKNISARVNITANYKANGTTYSDSDYIVVSEGNLEDIFILPPVWRFNAFLSNGNILSILVGTLAGIVGARWANSFAGVGLFVLVMLVGWFAGYATTGIMLVAVFVGAWLGLNLAANIDYTVRQ